MPARFIHIAWLMVFTGLAGCSTNPPTSQSALAESSSLYVNPWRIVANYEIRDNLPALLGFRLEPIRDQLLQVIATGSAGEIASEMMEAATYGSDWAVAIFRAATVVPHDTLLADLLKTGLVPCDLRKGRLTPGVIAVVSEDIDAVRALIEQDCDLNYIDPDGSTPLSLAMQLERFDIANLIFENGGDVSLAGPGRMSPANIARSYGLLDKMDEYPDLKLACEVALGLPDRGD